MGEVYSAFDPELERQVAIKTIQLDADADAARHLEKEARALARVRHPNIVTVYDVGVHDGGVFVAMELLQGEPLSGWIAPPKPWLRVVEVFLGAAEGLAAVHEVGIVHRDFKPANVMVEPDGRVVVLDFGLARLHRGVGTSHPVDPHASVDGPSTRSVVGTPGYMAPEQLEGDPATAASDQFAWCVSLFEALHGQRPFSGRHVVELLADIRKGPHARHGPGAHGVPPWLDRIVLRGLAADPAQRHASMRALADRLRAGLRRRARVRWIAGGVAGATVVALVAARGTTAAVGPEVGCVEEGAAALRQVWTDQRRAQIEAAFARSDRPHAAATVQRLAPRLSRYADSWRASLGRACVQTHVQRTASVETLAARQRCLQRQTVALRATVDVLAEAGQSPEIVDQSLALVSDLADPARCLGPDATAHAGPDDEDTALPVVAATAEAAARRRAGQFDLARAKIDEAHTAARRRPSDAALVDVLAERAKISEAQGDYDAALDDAMAVLAVATELELPARQAHAALHVMVLHGLRRAEYDHARRWQTIAAAATQHLPADDELRRRLLWYDGAIGRRRGDAKTAETRLRQALAQYEAAEGDPLDIASIVLELALCVGDQARWEESQRLTERALELRKQALGPRHPGVADTYSSLATVAGQQGRHDEAIALGERALAIYEDGVDPRHPHVATLLNNLGIARASKGEYDQALASYDRSLSIREQVLGPTHEDVAETLTNRGWSLTSVGEHEAARADLERARTILERAKGPQAPDLAAVLANLGQVAQSQGDLDLATDCLRRGLQIAEATQGRDHPAAGIAHHNLGDLLAETGHCRDAIVHFEQAIAIFDDVFGEAATQLAYPLTSLGRCELEAGDVAAAQATLRRAWGIRDGAEVPPQELGTTAMTLAAALWADPSTRDEAQAIAEAGISAFARDGERSAAELADARAWLQRQRAVTTTP